MNTEVTLEFSVEVRSALDRGAPIVALESSVFAQGLPIPANADAADRMTHAITTRGATPAVTAISRGRPTIGLEGDDLKRFLCRDGVQKVSSRDMGVVITRRADGATTVAGTLVLARIAGIQVFATGGIGGIHRRSRAEVAATPQIRDESADLLELTRSRAVVVCAGAKSILDLPATWERLETLGVPVIGYGTSELPGFFTAETGIALGVRCDTAAEIAAVARNHWSLGNTQSVVVAQAPPARHALSGAAMERAVAEAIAEAESQGVEGPAMTPFLLSAVSRLTNRRSLDVNLDLLENNAALAAEIACAFASR